MDTAIDLSAGHAHVVYGTKSSIEDTLQTFQSKTGKELFNYKYKNLLIDDVRAIQARVSQTSVSGQLVIIEADALVLASQNALLKMLEEPQEGTTFVLILPVGSYVIDTVLSRVQVHNPKLELDFNPGEFLAMTYKEREDFLKSFVNDDDSYARATTARFFKELLSHCLKIKEIDKGVIKRLEELSRYTLDVSSSIKHISLAFAAELPVIKSQK